jgi:hypothetical protein
MGCKRPFSITPVYPFRNVTYLRDDAFALVGFDGKFQDEFSFHGFP